MKANKRLVKYYDLNVRAHARDRLVGSIDLPARPFSELIGKLKNYLAVSPCNRTNRSKTETWHIADIEFAPDQSSVSILVTRSDKLSADQAISDPVTQHFQVATKVNNQGNAFSAHVVVKLAPFANNTYTALVEDAIGIGSGDIAMLLKLVTKAATRADREFFMCNDASGDPGLRRLSEYTYEFRAHPSNEFEDELNNGKLKGIELVQVFPGMPQFDGIAGTQEKKKVVHLTMQDAPVPMFTRIGEIARSAVRQQVGHLRVIFNDTADFRRTVELDAITMNLVNEDKYVRKVKLEGFAQKLNTGYERVHPETVAKLRALL
ncbi:hypothetical protein [Duganella sp. BuS-21]|uniref:hypothetical protein n=1 Tax=Duganella sp. BuS-21 TaxID=2943848 RepID=UPI0035A62E89